jgi:hypothetical protein
MRRFEIDFLEDNSDESLLNEMRRVAANFSGRNLTIGEFSKLSPRVSASTIVRRFGTWANAVTKAGLEHRYVRPNYDTSDEFLLDEIRRVGAQYSGRNLTVEEFSNLSPRIHISTITRRFGSWGDALIKAGLAHRYIQPRRHSDEECFDNLANVWTRLGRRPSTEEMRHTPSTIGPDRYRRRWGTWKKALKAFVAWANDEGGLSQVEAVPDVLQTSSPILREEARREVRPGLRFKVFLRDRFRCLACGRSPATHLNVELHADHIVSVRDGGKTTFENLQTLCRDCNLGKGSHSIRQSDASPT